MSSDRSDQRFRVLVVDDEKPVLDLIEEVLQGAGWDAAAFDSPIEALSKAKRSRFDALVLDVYMPELPGMLFHAKLKVFDPELAERTVFVSGHFSREELRRYLSEQAVLLPKPFRPQELVERIKKLLPPEPRSSAGD